LPWTTAAPYPETPLFTKLVYEYLSDEGYSALQWALTLRPDAGSVIPGIRKMRWAGKGHGKRGGLRILYYWRNEVGRSGC
jgi:hypothetical protein